MADNQTEFWRRVLNPPDPVAGNSLVEFSQGGVDPTGALVFPMGTTAQRPAAPVDGMMRYNTTLGDFEFYNTIWQIVSGAGGISLSEIEDADADTKIFVENSTGADDDIIAFILGDNGGLYDETSNALTFSTAGFSINALNADSGNTAGVALSLTAGDGNLAGVGAALTLAAGTGGATGAGGNVTIDAGAGGATSGAGGSIALTAGTPPISGAAGVISLTAGNGGSGVAGGNIDITAGDGNIDDGGNVTISGGTVSSGAGFGGNVVISGGTSGAASDGGAITIVGGTGSEANGGAVTVSSGAGTAGADDGGALTLSTGAGGGAGTGGNITLTTGGGGTDGVITLEIGGTEGLSVEVDGTLSVPVLTAGGAAYETQVTDDDDIPNKRFVDDAIAAAAGSSVPLLTPVIGNVPATPKVALGPLGFGVAAFPPGSFAFVTDDATGPTAFILAYVDGTASWIRSDPPFALIS